MAMWTIRAPICQWPYELFDITATARTIQCDDVIMENDVITKDRLCASRRGKDQWHQKTWCHSRHAQRSQLVNLNFKRVGSNHGAFEYQVSLLNPDRELPGHSHKSAST
jgi:hypothetical protein